MSEKNTQAEAPSERTGSVQDNRTARDRAGWTYDAEYGDDRDGWYPNKQAEAPAQAAQQAGQGEALVDDTHLRRVHDLLDEIPHMLALDRRHESVSKLVHENVMNIRAHLNRLPVTPPAPQQPEALAQQERDREDAERYRVWRDNMIAKPPTFLPAMAAALPAEVGAGRRPTAGEWDAALDSIRAARSSEGGQP